VHTLDCALATTRLDAPPPPARLPAPGPKKNNKKHKKTSQALQQRLQEAEAEADEQVERKRVMDRHARAVESEISACEARVRCLLVLFGGR
jgi:hypothetical protein